MTPVAAGLSTLDCGIVALYLALLAAVGFYYAGRQATTGDFCLAGRSLGRWPLALSLTGTLVTAAVFLGLPAAAYEQGLKCLVVPAAVWIVLPIVVAAVLPIFRGLGVATLHEYLELRFDARVRLIASLALVVWRLVWLAAMIELPSRALSVAFWTVPSWWLVVGLGTVTTLYVAAGGMRSVVRNGVVHVLVMFIGGAVVIVAVWGALDGGAARVTEVAAGLDRLSPADFSLNLRSGWSLWGALPHWIFVALMFYGADQVAAQRLLAAKSIDASRSTFVFHALAISLLQAALIYLGLCLLAFYNDHPQAMRPQWVANVDNMTREPIAGPDGQPLLDPAQDFSSDELSELVRQKRLLRPNSKEPFDSVEELIDPETGELSIEKLAMRRPTPGPIRGEIIVARGAPGEMLPAFIREQLPWGAAGLAVVALLAAAMSSLDAGIHAIATVVLIDWQRRFGLAKSWLARRVGKPAAELTERDEMRLARPLTLAIGTAATLLALALGQRGEVVGTVVRVTEFLGAPLLGIFLLGLFTRRCTSGGALTALFSGGLAAGAMTAAISRPDWSPLPAAYLPHEIWVFPVVVVATLLTGIVLSPLVGRRKTNVELRGLVFGCGQPGVLASEEEVTVIGDVETRVADGEGGDEVRWK